MNPPKRSSWHQKALEGADTARALGESLLTNVAGILRSRMVGIPSLARGVMAANGEKNDSVRVTMRQLR
jgi:hypothetical protein